MGMAVISGAIFCLSAPKPNERHVCNDFINRHGYYLLISFINIILIAIFFWKHDIGLQGDEIFQGEAIRQISHKGIPLFDSGLFYTRGILVSYLGAIFYFLTQSIELATRLPNLIFAVILLNFIAYQLRQNKYDRSAIVLGLSLLFLNPWTINILKISRLYIPLTTIVVITLFLFYRSLKEKNLSYYVAGIAAFIVGFLIHKGIFMLIPQIVVTSCVLLYKLKGSKSQSFLLGCLLTITALASVLFIHFSQNSRLFESLKSFDLNEIFSWPPNMFPLTYLIESHTAISLLGGAIFISSIVSWIYWRQFTLSSFITINGVLIFLSYAFVNVANQPRYFYPLFTVVALLAMIFINNIVILFWKNRPIRFSVYMLSIAIIFSGVQYTLSYGYGLTLKKENAISYAASIIYNDKNIADYAEKNIPDDALVISAGSNDLVHSFYTTKIDYFLNGHGTTPRTLIAHIPSYHKFIEILRKNQGQDIYILTAYDFFAEYNDLKENKPFTHYSERVQSLVEKNGQLIYSTDSGKIFKFNSRDLIL